MNFNNTCTSTLSEDGEVSFHSELMKNYVAESLIDGNHQLKVIHNGEIPLLFTISTKQELFVIYPKDGTQSGWEQHQLSNGLGEVTAFDISQDSSGAFLIGMATKKEGVSSLFINELTLFSSINWETFNPDSFWQKFELEDNEETINLIKADPEGILFATERKSQDARYYTLDTKSGIQQYQLPENGSTVLHMRLGKVQGNRGVFLLYQLGENQTMLFQSFPDLKYHKTVKYRYDTGSPMEDFFLIQNEEGTDHLYTAGDGVFLFTDPDVPKQIVVEKTGNINFKHIEAAKDGNKVTLWLRGEDQGQKRSLYLVENQFHAGNGDISIRWNKPLPLMSEVEQFTCLGGKEISNHLFFIKSDNTLSYLWQDATTTLWQQQPIPLSSSGQGREIDTYSLNLQFNPIHFEKKIKLRASSAIYVKINSTGYLLSPNKYAEISLNLQGTINLVKEVNKINAPTLYIEAEFIENEIAIDLTHKTCERLRTIKQGKDLANAKKQDGTSLWKDKGSKPDNNTMNKTSLAIQKFLDTKEHLEKKTANRNGVNEIWQMQFNKKKKLSVYSGHQAEQNLQNILQKYNVNLVALAANADPLDEFGHSIGDFFQWVGDRVVDITDFVCKTVGDVVTFVIEIAGEIFQFVIKTAEAVLSAMMWLLEKIYLFLADLIEWIGFIFNWEDIVITKNVIKAIFNCSVNSAVDNIPDMKCMTKDFFKMFRKKVVGNKLELPPELANKKINLDYRLEASPFNTPQVSWAFQYQTSSQTFQPAIPPPKVEIDVEGLDRDKVKILQDKLSKMVDGSNANILNMDIGTMFSTIIEFVSETIVDTVEDLTLALIELLELAIHSLQVALNHHWDIFLLTWLYENIIAPGCKLSLLDLMCLLIAIPSTVLSKIIYNRSPFSKTDEEACTNAKQLNDIFKYFSEPASTDIKMQNKLNMINVDKNESHLSSKDIPSEEGFPGGQKAPPLWINNGFYIISIVSSGAYACLNSINLIPTRIIHNYVFQVDKFKFIASVVNVVTSAITYISSPPHIRNKNRDNFYIWILLYQGLFVFVDFAEAAMVKVYTTEDFPMTATEDRREILGAILCGMGIFNAVLFISLAVVDLQFSSFLGVTYILFTQSACTAAPQIADYILNKTLGDTPPPKLLLLTVAGFFIVSIAPAATMTHDLITDWRESRFHLWYTET